MSVKPAGPALEMLIRQFSQPLACLRELVQNSIDAGSNQVEVTLVEEDQERVCLSVRDTGEGMNRAVIETQLTRLFASSKDGDLTKVGKFGIGFVSVFGLYPLAVVVDTGRDGESWRILFHADRSFELLRLPQRVEGTVVHLHLPKRTTSFQQKLQAIEQTLTYWCKHCRVEISLNGRVLSRPFQLDLPFQVSHEQTGTRMVLGLTGQPENFAGFYNQGLTLLEGECSPIPYLSFKVDSRYFEHTLTRDNVVQDEDYEKALTLIRQATRTTLAPSLFERLRQNKADWALLDSLPHLGISAEEEPLFADLQGKFHSLHQLRQQPITHQATQNTLSESLPQLVLRSGPAIDWLIQNGLDCPPTDARWGYCQRAERRPFGEILEICEQFLQAQHLPPMDAIQWQGIGPKRLLWPAAGLGTVSWHEPCKAAVLLLDVEHPVCRRALQLRSWSPAVAAQLLLQHYLLSLPEGRRLELGPRLSEAVLQRL
ncbi:hypothetical protein ABS71_11060 [bacterium SCN 62-11]|nr:MAG: hypothetical protein ABS71_11060 [bacterium SCN 62-11]